MMETPYGYRVGLKAVEASRAEVEDPKNAATIQANIAEVNRRIESLLANERIWAACPQMTPERVRDYLAEHAQDTGIDVLGAMPEKIKRLMPEMGVEPTPNA